MAANNPAPEFNDGEKAVDDSPPPPAPSIPIHFNRPDDEEPVVVHSVVQVIDWVIMVMTPSGF
jgi:hypothetical protein